MCDIHDLEEGTWLTKAQVIAFWEEYDIPITSHGDEADAELEQVSREGVPRDVPELEDSATTTCDVIYASTDT